MTRVTIEAILLKHAVGINTLMWPQGKSMQASEAWDALLNDLLVPTPHVIYSHPPTDKNKYYGVTEALIDSILSWALGQPDRMVWSEHCIPSPIPTDKGGVRR